MKEKHEKSLLQKNEKKYIQFQSLHFTKKKKSYYSIKNS